MLLNSYQSIAPALDSAAISTIARSLLDTFCPIFMLHRIECPDRKIPGRNLDLIQQQLEYVHKKGYQPIPLSKLAQCIADNEPLPEKAVAFTIDDGFIDHFDLAGPIFAKFDIALHYFLITDFINGKIWPWDDQVKHLIDSSPLNTRTISVVDTQVEVDLRTSASRKIAVKQLRDLFKGASNSNLASNLDLLYKQFETEPLSAPPPQYQAMSWDNANKLLTMGHEIGAHTKTHRILSQLTHSESEDEILGSIQTVKKMTRQCSPVFCYPTGRDSDFTIREEHILQNSDCFAAVTNQSEHLGQYHNPYQIPRLSLPSNMIDFIQCISWVEYVKNKIRKTLHL